MKKPRQLVQVEVLCQPTIDVSVTSDPLTNIDIEEEIIPGVKGATFIPSVSSEGIISWTNDGGLPNPDPVDITGPQGEPGPIGPEGPEGFSPSASVSKDGTVISIVMVDKEGTTSVQFDSYSIPLGGIPKSDLSLGVQSSLDRADTALQLSDFDLIDCGTSSEVV